MAFVSARAAWRAYARLKAMPPESFYGDMNSSAFKRNGNSTDAMFNNFSTAYAKKFYQGGFDTKMTVAEAMDILGMTGDAPLTKRNVRAFHRRVMIQNHPDKGGSPYLAQKINEAKELLDQMAK